MVDTNNISVASTDFFRLSFLLCSHLTNQWRERIGTCPRSEAQARIAALATRMRPCSPSSPDKASWDTGLSLSNNDGGVPAHHSRCTFEKLLKWTPKTPENYDSFVWWRGESTFSAWDSWPRDCKFHWEKRAFVFWRFWRLWRVFWSTSGK